ncbi:hypothetical protein RB595_009887 [Gaeumannomyces hyphopodioides]
MPSPIITATIQSTVLAATSNLIAQALGAYKGNEPFVLDWVPLFQFALYAVLSTPPNFLWQELLEQTFPSSGPSSPSPAAVAPNGKQQQKQQQPKPKEGGGGGGKLSVGNTVAKLALDQTVGAALNTVMFSVFLHSAQAAMAHRPASPADSLAFLAGGFGAAIDYSAVRWDDVWARATAEFVPLLVASWRLWPLVSLVNFAFVRSVATRNLVGGLAGVGWGVYVSMFAAGR